MVASSGARLLEDDAVDALVARLFPLATVVTPNLLEAQALVGATGTRRELAERLVALGAPRGDRHRRSRRRRGRPPLRRPRAPRDPGRAARRRARRTAPGCTHSATLAALLARGLPLADAARGAAARRDRRRAARPGRARRGRRPRRRPQRERKRVNAGESLRRLRETKPLVHQITNYVVMNETANATLALGALPVMAHAREEVEEMVAHRGRARAQHRHALAALGRRDAARGPGRERARRAGRARPGRRRRDDAIAPRPRKRILDEVDVTVLRGNAGEVATLVGVAGRGARRRVDRRGRRPRRARAHGRRASSASSRR